MSEPTPQLEQPADAPADANAAASTEGAAPPPVPVPVPLALAAGLLAPAAVFAYTGARTLADPGNGLPASPAALHWFWWVFAVSAVPLAALAAAGARRLLPRGVLRAVLALGLAAVLLVGVRAATEPVLRNFTWVVVLDLMAVLAAVLVAARAPVRVVTGGAAALAVLLLVAAVRLGHAGEGPPAAAADVPPVGNVYHVLLDGYQREAFDLVLQDHPELRLPGFTYYPRSTVQYSRTVWSVPSILTGSLLAEGQRMGDWRDGMVRGGLWRDLHAAGLELTIYPLGEALCSPFAERCLPADAQPAVERGNVDPTTFGVSAKWAAIDAWFTAMLPRSLALLLTGGERLLASNGSGEVELHEHRLSIVNRVLSPEARGEPQGSTKNLSPAYSAALFERMLADEPHRPAHGQYVFLHASLPHYPWALDGGCGYVGMAPEPSVEAYMAQAECGVRLIARLVETLKALGRYDDALIVVHGDHGVKFEYAADFMTRYADALRPEVRPVPGESEDAAAVRRAGFRAGGLLLVKQPGARGFTVSPVRAQALDIVPTILRHVGAPTDQYAGIPLQELDDSVDRPAEFYFGYQSELAFNTVPRDFSFSRYVLEHGAWRAAGTVRVNP